MNWVEYLKRFVGRSGGTQLATGKSIVDAIGHDGTDALPAGTLTTINANIASAEGNIRGADGDTLETISDQIDVVQSSRDFWSAASPTVTISATQGTIAIIPTVVIPTGTHGIPVGATIDCVHILAKWRQTEDTSGVDNAIDNTAAVMKIQVDDSGDTGWLDAYSFADNSYFVDGDVYSFGAGDMIEGITDIKARVDAMDTYDIQLLNAECDADNLILRDFQWGLRISWH
ncbi:MAG: hypothetical protein H8D67_18935 [Deltaproteobacteria bacterium]|nr:hypothetical protein [Deltaproteobacteria bacterium]